MKYKYVKLTHQLWHDGSKSLVIFYKLIAKIYGLVEDEFIEKLNEFANF